MTKRNDVISRYQRDIELEIEDLKKNGSKKYKIFAGVLERAVDGNYYYRFECDSELNLAEGYPIHIDYRGSHINGVVQKIEGIFIWLMSKHNLGNEVSNISISCDAWALLEALDERLEECKHKPTRLLSSLISYEVSENTNNTIIPGKEALREYLFQRPISFIWGPPGTGKTTTLAKTAIEYYKKGRKVLIVSHSNVSVDQAILKIVSELKNMNQANILERGDIMRYGFLKTDEIKEETYVTEDGCIEAKSSKVKKLLKKIETLKKSRKANQKDDELKKLELQLKTERVIALPEILSDAKIVATTISKIAIDENFIDGKLAFDVVIFDEASMAYVPQIFYACSLAKRRFLCFGDFMQLAPISQCEEANLLKEDIYTFLGITNGEGDVIYHPWLVMLDEQYRTHPNIVKFVNKNIYHGLIKNAKALLSNPRLYEITDSLPFKNNPLVMLDLSDFYAPAHRTETSRINVFNALVAFLIALEAEKKGNNSVGIITPYAAQAKLIRRMIIDYRQSNQECRISCSTIHQFQGSERDVIIFDTLESYPRSRPGRLTSSNENNALNRLVNVAVTRSKGKLILLANKSFWDITSGRKNAIRELVNYVAREGVVLKGEEIKNYLRFKNYGKIRTYFNTEEAIYDYSMDLRGAKKELLLSCPNGKIDPEIWENELIKKVTTVENPPELFIKRTDDDYNRITGYGDYAQIDMDTDYPLSIIDNKIAWYDMPKFDRKYYRMRKKYNYTTQSVIFRIDGEYTSDIIKSMSDITKVEYLGNLLDYKLVDKMKKSKVKDFIESNYRCSTCGRPLTLAYKNNYYCKCVSGNHNEFLTKEMVEKFIYRNRITCPICGEDLTVRIGGRGLYISCANRHVIDLMNLTFDDSRQLEEFELSTTSFSVRKTFIKIKVSKNNSEIQYYKHTQNKSFRKTIRNSDWTKQLLNLNIYEWDASYIGFEGMLDGDEWQIKYKEKGKEVKYIQGCNEYPEYWNELLDILMSISINIKLNDLKYEVPNESNYEDDFFIDYYYK